MILRCPLSEARVAVVAPAGPCRAPAALAAGLDLVRARVGSVIEIGDIHGKWRHFAGTDGARRSALAEALTRDDVDLVWAMRGGYGTARLLDGLPWGELRSTPVIGFSDLTTLLDQLERRLGSRSVHGPMLHSLSGLSPRWLEPLFALLDGGAPPTWDGEAWVPGEASGPVRGGNLALIAAHCGTPWQIDARGALLALEDVGEPAYRIDRLLVQLRQAGVFDGVAGVLLGTFSGITTEDDSYGVDDVVRELVSDLAVPVLARLPFGHTAENAAFAIGGRARIQGSSVIFG